MSVEDLARSLFPPSLKRRAAALGLMPGLLAEVGESLSAEIACRTGTLIGADHPDFVFVAAPCPACGSRETLVVHFGEALRHCLVCHGFYQR